MPGRFAFLRYAFPCAESQFAKGVINENEHLLLKRWVLDNEIEIPPMREILEKAFSDAVSKLKELAELKNREPWSLENVLDFWRNHHNYKKGDCNVACVAVVVASTEGHIIKLVSGSIALNLYNLEFIDFAIGYVHKGILIETM